MIIDDGPAPQFYYDMAGNRHYYDPERAILDGRLKLAGVGGCASCGPGVRSLRGRGLGILGEPWDTIAIGTGAALGVGVLVWLLRRKTRRGRR